MAKIGKGAFDNQDGVIPGDLTIQGDLTVEGTVNQGSETIVGNQVVSGNLTVGGTSAAAGLITGAAGATIAGNINASTGDVLISTIGKSLKVKSGANAKAGTFTANGVTAVVVSNTSITANSVVVVGLKTIGGTPAGAPFMSAVTPGTSFSMKAVAGDTSVYNYIIADLIP